jgi:hypothetical protein
MRKIILTAAAVTLAAPMGAALADNDVGCGVGTQLWEGNSGVAPKVLAATTNASSGNQTFGISSGTLGCTQGGTVTADARISMFASANLDTLASQMAAGQGEALNSLAELYGIHSQRDKQEFFSMTQRHFGQIFPSEQATTGQVLAAVQKLMAQDPELSHYAANA